MSRLSCRDLELSIGGKRVVQNLTLDLAEGQFWGLMGANGIGKTTLMRCLAGLITPERGEILLDGTNIAEMRRRDIARKIGMMQQHTVYVFDASVLQSALTGRHPHLGQWQRESQDDLDRARTAILEAGLGGMEERSVTSLSGGEARRLAFASLRVQDPELMLLDEPSNHLDLKHQVLIMSTIGEAVYSGNRTAVAATHDVNLAACYCSHVLMLFGDGEWGAGPAPDMFSRTQLERLYQCPVEVIQTPAGMRFHPSFDARSN
jgi:iron complex transport system ATP-binding protein